MRRMAYVKFKKLREKDLFRGYYSIGGEGRERNRDAENKNIRETDTNWERKFKPRC